MDSWELTKIAAAVLTALLIIFGGKELVHISTSGHAKPAVGYALPVKAAATATAAAPAAGMSFAAVKTALGKATPAGGQDVFKKCTACHTVDKGGANRVGPNLWGIVGRGKASVPGYAYSDAAKAKASEKWTWEGLSAYLNDPRGYLPGTKMVFAGIQDPAELADLLAYMRAQADTPAPLPQ